MKKFTLLFAMLIGMISSAWAQMVDVPLDREGWTVLASSACDDSDSGQAQYMLDGKTNTFWHSNWGGYNPYGGSGVCPQAFQINMGSVQEFYSITIQNRTDSEGNGRVKDYSVYISNEPFTTSTTGFTVSDVISGKTPVMTGTFTNGSQGAQNTASNDTPLNAQYILFVITDSYNQNGVAKYAHVAEVNVYTKVDEGAAAKIALHNAIVAAGNLTTGTGFATYDATQVANAITVAQGVYDSDPTKTEAENAIVALNTALIAADNTPGNWTMMTNGRSGNNYLGYSETLKGTAATAADADAITFEATETAGQYIISIGEYYFTNCTQSTQVGVTTEKASAQTYQVAKNSDGTCGVQSTDGGAYQWFHLDGNNPQKLVGWTQDSGASKWVFEKIKTYATITYQIKDGEDIIWQQDVEGAIGYSYPECQINPWVSVVVPEGTVSVAETKVVTYTSTVQTFANVADVNQWYTMDIHGNASNYQVYNDGGDIRVVNNGTSTDYRSGEVYPREAWAFIGNPITGVKVYNNKAQKFVLQPSDADVEVIFDETGSLFQVCATTSGIANAFALKVNGRSYYLNHRQQKIQGWTAADAGSAFRVWAVNIRPYVDLTAMNAAKDRLNSKTIGTALGEYHETSEGAKAAALEAAAQFTETTPSTEQDEVEDATMALNNAVAINLPTVGYDIRFKGYSGNYISAATTGTNAPMVALDGNENTTVFRLLSDGTIISTTTNTGFTGTHTLSDDQSATYNIFTITEGSEIGTYQITSNASGVGKIWYDNTNNGSKLDRNSSPATQTNWSIEFVPVAATMRITAAAKWGTFCAPYDVTIPTGVQAYTGTLITENEGNPWISMNELTEGIIPANTGVVVWAKDLEADESWIFNEVPTLAEGLTSCYSTNLTGSIMNIEQGAYLLQKQGDQVGWYKVAGEGFTLAPNRCYLAKNTVPEASQARSFIGFEPVDDATGINSIATEAATKADGKYMVNGQIVVVKAGKAYTTSGTLIK